MGSDHPEFDQEVYATLRAVAGSMLRGQRPGHTLEPTAVVHEAWMRLDAAGRRDGRAAEDAEGAASGRFRDRGHFVATAARAMRQILVDHARRRGALKRGGGGQRLTLDPGLVGANDTPPIDVLLLEEGLAELERLDPRQALVVELRCFGGLDNDEVAARLGVSPRTAQLDWQMARSRLRRHLAPETRDGS